MERYWAVVKLGVVAGIFTLFLGACGGGGSSSGNPGPGPGSATGYTLSGSINGLTASGLQLSDGTDVITVTANATSFMMPTKLSANATYTVVVANQPVGLNCTVAQGGGVMPAADVSNVMITCSAAGSTSTFSWTAASAVSATGSLTAYTPSLATMPNGKVFLVYAQSETGANNVYAVLGDYATATWGTPVPLTSYDSNSTDTVQTVSNVSGNNQSPSSTVVAASPVSGAAMAAWTTKNTTESTYRVWASAYDPVHMTWSTAQQVGTATQWGLRATSSAAGGLAVAWIQASTTQTGNQALGVFQVSDLGVPSSDVLELGANGVSGLQLGLDDGNRIVVAWAGASQEGMLAIQGSSSWASPIDLGTAIPNTYNNIDMTVNTDGSGAIVWGSVSPVTAVHAVIFNSSGSVTSDKTVSVSGSLDNMLPAVVALGNGKYIMMFASTSLSTGSIIYYQEYSSIYDPLSDWSTPAAVTGSTESGYCQLNVDSQGNVVAVSHGYNQDADLLPSGKNTWVASMHIQYNGAVPAVAMDSATGNVVFAWAEGSGIASEFYK